MKILFLSALYSSPALPEAGIANGRIVRQMRAHATMRVVAPLPWYPAALAQRSERLRAVVEVPHDEIDDDGSTVLHPRIAHIPRFGRSLYPALYAASLALPLRRIVNDFQPDVLMSAWAYPDGTAAAALGQLLGLPSVLRVMGSDINDFGQQALRRPQIRWALRRHTRIIAVSRALGAACEELGARATQIDVIPTGVDRSRFHAVDRAAARAELGLPPVGEAKVVVVPGRLSPEKGQSCFVDAWERAARPNWRAVLVGDGAERPALEERIRSAGLAVELAGFQPEPRMKTYYSAADLVCLPSTEEGWPNVLMESYACGCPWVASDVGGVGEILALVGAGALVPHSDPAALADALTNALDRDWDRDAIAAKVADHSLDATARSYVATCAAAAAGPPD